MFSGLTGRRVLEDFAWFEQAFPLMETLNGSMPRRANREAAGFARKWRKGATAGSDSHTLRSVGNAWTEVPAAANAAEFLDGLRAGFGRVRGASGSYGKPLSTWLYIFRGCLGIRGCTTRACTLAVRMVTLVKWIMEAVFRRPWLLELAPDSTNSGGGLHVIPVSGEEPA